MTIPRWLNRASCLALALLALSCGSPSPNVANPSVATPAGASAAGAAQPPAAGAAAAGVVAPAAPPDPVRLRIAYTAISGSIWPIWIAQDAGLLRQQGIESELEYVASSGTATQAMLAGEIPIIPSLSAPTVIQAVLGGADAVIVGATNNTVVFYLMATSEVRDYADLRGKRVGISRLGSSSDAAARFALGKWGLRPDEDVAIAQMGGIPEVLAGMQSGAIQAGVLSSPTDLRARQAGYHELADLGLMGIDYPQTTIGTTRTYLRNNAEVVRRYLRATVEAVHLLKTDVERAKVIFSKYADVTDPAMLDATYRAYVDKTESVPYIKPAAVQTAIDEVAQTDPRAASSRPEEFIDNRYVEELETSGFIRQVLGR
jgi:NitT/TauT family transport system substrate-binding protein